jgi:FAD/FMN-containing dehydrogenase
MDKKHDFQLSKSFRSQVAQEFPADFITQEPLDLENFGRDWTRVYPPNPSAIVFPRSTDEVSRFLKLCQQNKTAVVPSGGRTGLAGGAVATSGEVVLNLTRMNQLGPIDTLGQTIRVQAGAVTEAIHHQCEPLGLTWPIDFASKGSSQVGGNIATNAGGLKVIRYGLTRQWVLGLQVVTMDGTILELNGALEKNNTGVDLRQLFIGSEGTLGIITEATLKLTSLPGQTEVFFFALDGIPSVLKLFQECRNAPFRMMAFECLTENCLQLVTQTHSIPSPFQKAYPAYVLLEVESHSPESFDPGDLSPRGLSSGGLSNDTFDRWLETLFEKNLVVDGTLASSPQKAKELWSLREDISECLSVKGFVHKNDIALPICALEAFISELYALFSERHSDLEIFLFGHIGDGNLHVNTLKSAEMTQEDFIQTCKKADQALFELVKKHAGSISAEHGIGLLKKSFLHYSRSPEELSLMKGIKKLFDPQGLLNPRKILEFDL